MFEDLLNSIFESVVYCDLHPRTSILIILQEIQDDGCILSSAINAGCCALLDAGIPMRYLVSSSTVIVDNKNHIVIDPKLEASQDCLTQFVTTFESVNYNIVSIVNEGSFDATQLKEAIKLSQLASKEIFQVYKESMNRRFLCD